MRVRRRIGRPRCWVRQGPTIRWPCSSPCKINLDEVGTPLKCTTACVQYVGFLFLSFRFVVSHNQSQRKPYATVGWLHISGDQFSVRLMTGRASAYTRATAESSRRRPSCRVCVRPLKIAESSRVPSTGCIRVKTRLSHIFFLKNRIGGMQCIILHAFGSSADTRFAARLY